MAAETGQTRTWSGKALPVGRLSWSVSMFICDALVAGRRDADRHSRFPVKSLRFAQFRLGLPALSAAVITDSAPNADRDYERNIDHQEQFTIFA